MFLDAVMFGVALQLFIRWQVYFAKTEVRCVKVLVVCPITILAVC